MIETLLKRTATYLIMTAFAATAIAVPPKPGLVTVSQPDGTTFQAEIKGDASFHWYLTPAGELMAADGSDGFIRPVSAERLEAMRVESLRHSEAVKADAMKRVAPAEIKLNFPTTGTVRGLIVLAEYQDVKFQPGSTQEYFDRKVNQPNYEGPETYGSVNDYFREQSGGIFTPEFDIVGPVTLPKDRASYGMNEDLDGQFRDAAYQAIKEYDADFSRYDVNGDSFVDFFFVIFAGHAESQGGGAECIWPAMKDLSDFVFDSFGGLYLGVAACSSELKGASGTDLDGVGTICHEFSHILGLPDIYDPMGSGYGMGHFDVMCYGPYNDDGRTPCNYTAMEKFNLGWLNPPVLDSPATGLTLNDFGETDECYFIVNPEDPNEYYTLENRQLRGFDSALPGHGMIITYCNYDKNAWLRNTVNSPLYSRYEHISIMPADNSRDKKMGEDSDPWPGTLGKTEFTDNTAPAAKWFTSNKPVGMPITNIAESADGVITFDFMSSDAVEEISADDAGVVYYNLQGLRVEKGAMMPGMYIRRSGADSRMVIVK